MNDQDQHPDEDLQDAEHLQDVDQVDAGPSTDAELIEFLVLNLQELSGANVRLSGAVGEMQDHLGGLQETVKEIYDYLIVDDEQPQDNVPPTERFRFERIPAPERDGDPTQPDESERRSGELRSWVSWLVGTYRLWKDVPPCWERHDALAEELAALYVAWAGAWSGRERSDQAVVWHSELDRAGERLRRWAGSCKAGRVCDFDDTDVRTAWQDEHAQLAASGPRYRVTQTLHIHRAPFPLLPPKKDTRGGKKPAPPSPPVAAPPVPVDEPPPADQLPPDDELPPDDGYPDEPPYDPFDDQEQP